MNKKIKDLMEKSKPLREDGSKVYGLNSDMHDKWLENFANMLIKECIDTVEEGCFNSGDEWDRSRVSAIKDIKEKFGVK